MFSAAGNDDVRCFCNGFSAGRRRHRVMRRFFTHLTARHNSTIDNFHKEIEQQAEALLIILTALTGREHAISYGALTEQFSDLYCTNLTLNCGLIPF